MRWSFGRPTTVRTRIVALALAPVLALMVLWSFAMVSVTGELRALVRVQGVYDDFGTPVDTAVGQIQIERRLAAAYLGADHGTAAALDLMEQQRRTDRAVTAMRTAIRDGDRGRLSARQRQVLDAVLRSFDGLEGLRERVLSRAISWDRAVTEYGALVEPGFDVQSALTALQAGQLAREAQVVIELVRVREFVSREDALVAGARAAGSLTDGQYDTLTATIEDRRVFERTYVPDLPADSRALFEEFQRGSLYRELTRGEDALLRAGARGAGEAVAAGSWRTTTDRAVKRYMQLCTRSAVNSAERGRAFAYRELAKAAIVGVLGLAAVGLSLWFAVRGARRISRRLETLRDAADLLTTRQLPDVMRRLGAGEDVDAATEAPPLADGEAGADEIGQVGRSFNTARLAAVEAAVKQATLRRGLFAVLLNIARRNQALVHRQLKLVDTLERRTEDPDVLDDLFRIDHLTTRMRRHAESLIILSGAAPGRRWRRPVPVARVVASAVGEIEEYARVVVPPMPEVGVAADAVADVVHLIAELVENATVFSPPHTQVTLRTGRAGGGFVLEIDDRGLGLEPEQIEEAHRTLTTPDDFDPTRHDRLGLYVVGRLAARHGIEVTLCRSPYGGTTAVVLLPEAVLAPVDPERPEPAADTESRALPSRTSRTAETSRTSETSETSGTSETSRKGTAVLEEKRLAPDRHTDRAEEQPEAPQRHADRVENPREAPLRHADRVPETAPATSPPALPTRVRQTSLAPELRTEGPATDEPSEREVTPEEVRAVFGAFQRGLDRGRKGLPTGSGSERRTDTEEGTDADDAP
ncbi:sensor histidine kinase [Streptomyces sp. S1A1-8]|uniref:sensor histidine kinase n=1 Tax=unclassified Streptomyces TaxID=2593676 RepID=UPI00116274B8|nr:MULTISPECIES: nitrate- and nitrite sensing domain-containing protein [unclassified Streptomyces]QDN97131.1 sensor histidine kinase [Streptomyces sp. RLB1-9]QDO18837.1 sensor histidine kinase [Streptomyces sp. S1A1-8]QDO28965.1 sensor histidine kinase [Streptomyces sp. S1A1-3]